MFFSLFNCISHYLLRKKPLFAASTGISGSGGGGSDDDDGFSSLGYSGSSSTSSSSSSSSWSSSQQRFKQKKLSSFAKTGKWRWKERSNGTASSLLLQKSTNATPQQLAMPCYLHFCITHSIPILFSFLSLPWSSRSFFSRQQVLSLWCV